MLLGALLAAQPACIRQLATGAMADALSEQSDLYAAESDPELAEAAIPFGLKTMEGVLDAQPEHRGLLLALCSGFTSYAYAFVEQHAFALELEDLDEARRIERRAMNLYFRARDYGLRSFRLDHPRFVERLRTAPEGLMTELDGQDVPLLYWTAAAWGLGIAASGMEPEAVADLPAVEVMVRRALELDEDWEAGALHEFMVVLETVTAERDLEAAEQHYRRALELSGGRRAGTFVSYAENIAVVRQDGEAFVNALEKALEVDVDAHPSERLSNIISQRRARALLDRSGDFFIDDPLEDRESPMFGRGVNVSLPPTVSWNAP